MSLNIGILGQVLFSPRKAFESIREQTTMGDGILMYLILSVVGAVIGMLVSYLSWGRVVTSSGDVLGVASWVISLVVGLIIGVIFLVIMGWLSSKIAASIGKGVSDVEKTVGMLGYAEIVNLIMGIITSIAVVALMGGMIASVVSSGSPSQAVQGVLGGAIAILLLGIVGFIWSLYVGGTGIAVANNVSTGAGIAAYFISALIIAVVLVAIVTAIVLSLGLVFVNSGGFMPV